MTESGEAGRRGHVVQTHVEAVPSFEREFVIFHREVHRACTVQEVVMNNNSVIISHAQVNDEELIKLSRPLEFTFHRAFDEVLNPINVLHQLIKLRADRILTSGQKKTAIDGIELIKKLINISNNNIKIMPGSGINSTNILEINKLNINEIHGSFSGSSKNNKKLSNFDEISSCIELMKSD